MPPSAFAEACALDDPTFVPVAADYSRPATELLLMSIGMGADGAFVIRSASRTNFDGYYARNLSALPRALKPHAAPARGRTPFDTAGARDAMTLFRLEPSAWASEATPGKALFMKDRQRHNPFAAPIPMPGNPRDPAVRYQAPTSLDGCLFEYNLGVVVRQNGLETPLVIDPGRESSGVGN